MLVDFLGSGTGTRVRTGENEFPSNVIIQRGDDGIRMDKVHIVAGS